MPAGNLKLSNVWRGGGLRRRLLRNIAALAWHPLACPACFGMMFAGQQFCPHCGAKADRQNASAPSRPEPCPRCKSMMEPLSLAALICASALVAKASGRMRKRFGKYASTRNNKRRCSGWRLTCRRIRAWTFEKQIRYLPCPVCGGLMNRVNFGQFFQRDRRCLPTARHLV